MPDKKTSNKGIYRSPRQSVVYKVKKAMINIMAAIVKSSTLHMTGILNSGAITRAPLISNENHKKDALMAPIANPRRSLSGLVPLMTPINNPLSSSASGLRNDITNAPLTTCRKLISDPLDRSVAEISPNADRNAVRPCQHRKKAPPIAAA